jgi:hypothetical protein
MTPEEFRRAMGLPDVQELQKELMNKMMDKMMSGEDGYDALSLFQPMMKEGMSTMDQMQKTMMNMMSGYMGGDKENNNE